MTQNYLSDLEKNVSELKPYKAILFGSCASGHAQEDSDIDLIIVLDKEDMPGSFSERMNNYSEVKRYFRSINQKIPLDLIVYTKAEWDKLLDTKNSFSREILENGRQLI